MSVFLPTKDLEEVLTDTQLTWKAKGLHTFIVTHSYEDGSWPFSMASLLLHTTDRRDSTRKGIKELVQSGCLVRQPAIRSDTGRFRAIRMAIIQRDQGMCRYCGKFPEIPQVDHKIPKSRGGPNTETNLVTSCKSCNSRKHDRTPTEAGMVLRLPPKGVSR